MAKGRTPFRKMIFIKGGAEMALPFLLSTFQLAYVKLIGMQGCKKLISRFNSMLLHAVEESGSGDAEHFGGL